MDFDGDGDIDYHDRELRHELVHNPNYLDLPETAGGIVSVSLLTALLGTAGGTAAAASSAAAGAGAGGIGSLPDLGRYIKRDEDGDLNVTDPATGEKRLYVNNGDGSYTNPLTGATYTEDELKESVSSRAENAGLIRQDTAAAQAAIAEQREDNQTLSQGAIEYSAEKARVEAEQAKEDHLDEMWLKYGGERGDADSIKAAAEAKQEREAANAAYYQNLGDRYDTAVKAAETVQTAADVGVDVLSTVTGNQGIKTAYTVGKNMASRLSDAHVNGGDMKMAAVMAGFDSIADITADKLEGSGFHLTANVGSDTFKKTMQNLSEGKDWNDGLGQAATTGAIKGTVAKLGSLMNDSASANTQEALSRDLEGVVRAKLGGMSDKGVRALRDVRLVTYVNNLHAEQAVNVATTVAVDAGKTVTDKVSEAYSELKEQMKKED